MRNFANFSDHDFERFVADLLGAEDGRRYETFLRGADQGVDLRFLADGQTPPDVVQCKHYLRSSFPVLLTAARRERERLGRLDPAPRSYRFVTSQPLSAHRKQQLAEALGPWIASPADILGAEDLDGLLDRHPDVERRQVKLWLTGGTQLAALLHSGTIHRSHALIEEIAEAMPRYVPGTAFPEARGRLREQHVLVIAGGPGVGKTTLARILLADAILDGYEPVEISNDIEQGWDLLDDGAKQIFYYDDFLGRTALAERFAKNEDRRLLDFMSRAGRRNTTLLVLTTREYILRQARQVYERLEQSGIQQRRFLLEMPRYSRLDRARIFANHAYHSPLVGPAARRQLLAGDAYERIIDHPNYKPRIIEWITGLGGPALDAGHAEDYVAFAADALDHPDRIWKHAFAQEIDDHGRALLLVVATLPRRLGLEHAESAFESLCRTRGLTLTDAAFRRALAALDDSLLKTRHATDWFDPPGILVEPHDPSIVDFVADLLRDNPADLAELVAAAVFFEQVEWLIQIAFSAGRPPSKGMLAALATALRRTYEAPGLQRVAVPASWSGLNYRPAGTIDFDARLLVVLELIDRAAHPVELKSWWISAVGRRADAWGRGEGVAPSALKLLAAADGKPGVDIAAAVQSVKAVLRTGFSLTQSTDWFWDLRQRFPAAFGPDEWDEVVGDFESWARGQIGDAGGMDDEEDLEFIEFVAGALGVVLDEGDVGLARETIRDAVAQREKDDEPDPVRWDPDADRGDEDATGREIAAIFARLAEQD
ncbi:MAG: restriction endonuclease [Solirubrobacteraceae bacterium]